jgi:phosphomevalonate kinase
MLPTEKEKVLQKYIFDHLWLLHPTWERASTNARIEETVTKEWGKIDAKLTKKEKSGRIDIRYTTAANKHVIVELKKYDRSVSITELYKQIQKYRSALVKILENNFQTERPSVETICILGSPPTEGTQEEIDKTLGALNARFVLYDQLVAEALNSYSDYLKVSKTISELIGVIEKLDSWTSN